MMQEDESIFIEAPMKAHRLRVKLREATRNAILEAAEEVAAQEGIAGASLQAIADRAGIAVGTIYNYFDDKSELFKALFQLRRQELLGAIDRTIKVHAKQPFAAQLEAYVRAVFTHFDGRRAFLRMALDREPHAAVLKPRGNKHAALQQLYERAERIVRIGLREKQLRDDDTAELMPSVLVAMVRAVLVLRADDERPFAADTERVVALFLTGAGK
jgi:AcrR family transcriptional regulator